MKKIIFSLLVLSTMLGSSQLLAHHSFAATFKEGAKITIEGVVTNFSFKNPHILVYTEVTNDDGSVTEWVSEGAAATLVRRAGWSSDTLKPGDMIRVTGDSTHDGSPMTSIDSIDVLGPDGSVAQELSPAGYRQNAQPTVKAAAMPLTLADGRPNLTGYWTGHGMGRGGPGGGAAVPLSEAGQALQDQFDLANDPQIFCDPPGLVRQAAFTPHPIKITQYEDRVVFEYEEYGGYREVYFDGRNARGIKTHLGDSIAYYEGDALVVETINLLSNQTDPGGHVLSDQTTTKEVYRRTDNDQYGPIVTTETYITDPVNLSDTYVISRSKMSAGDYEFIENDCQIPLREREKVNPVMSFFITSAGPGDGANLGGLEGGDAHCSALAETVGLGDKNWVAYLSTTGEGGVNARDRIGAGPWYNAKGEVVALDVGDLHGDATGLGKATSVSEQGKTINGRGDEPNRHDILTGSLMDGTASPADEDTTCSNWTSNGEGSALVGHHDRQGGGQNPTSWNQAHGSRGCGQEDLQGTGGDGLFYCFATDPAPAPSSQVLGALVPASASSFESAPVVLSDAEPAESAAEGGSSRTMVIAGLAVLALCLIAAIFAFRKKA